ncbi:MAG: primosomal protein N' [Caldilineae bacterium]|nr:MAG: primosomal protein N' [Caldilineae bacterium]
MAMADMSRLRYAEVIVLLPIDRRLQEKDGLETLVDFRPEHQTFTYGIPRESQGLYCRGQVVWVPFGRGKQQGVIYRLGERTDVTARIKPLGEPVTAAAVLTDIQLELALWMSREYLAPLSECVRLMLPPGFGASAQLEVEYTPGAPIYPDALSPAQQALMLHLRRGPILLSELRKLDRRLVSDEVLGALLKSGLVRLRERVKGGRPKARTERMVRLKVSDEKPVEALTRVGRRSKQADILLWLARHEGAEEVKALLAGVGCSRAPLKRLAEQGLVEIREDGRVILSVPAAEVPQVVLEIRGSAKYRAGLEALAQAADKTLPASYLRQSHGLDGAALKRLAEAGIVTLEDVPVWRDPLAGREFARDVPPRLTQDQAKAWEQIAAGLERWLGRPGRAAQAEGAPPVYLLHGVTGSGKTELYLRALQWAVECGRQGIVLVPEISLTPQTVRRFASRFPGRVAVVHSRLSDGERYDTWQRARRGEIDVVVGSRSALFTPFPALGVVVVDEEHDTAYKQMRTPRYHAREAAITLAGLCGAVTLLGSATPALESRYRAEKGRYVLLTLPRRIMGHGAAKQAGEGAAAPVAMQELPPVTVVDMRRELREGNRSMFSRALKASLQRVLARGEQAILFLNRRGAATYVFCRDCGYVLACPRCSIPLTHHRGDVLICHHCNYRTSRPRVCPTCGSRRFREFGAGTQRLIEALQAEFPQARPLRWDRDTTGGKSSHEAILQDFVEHRADVLVGTQMIAKGLDLPLVTLVGVLNADVGLFLPDFRAGERVFQVLTQVAGRAGRSALGGEVIFQTYHPDHPAILAASRHDYQAFYHHEMRFRQEQAYPPFARLTRLVYVDSNEERCERECRRVAEALQRRAQALWGRELDMVGPAPAFFRRERNRFRWHLMFRGEDPAALLAGVKLTPNWRIDVDPVDVL